MAYRSNLKRREDAQPRPERRPVPQSTQQTLWVRNGEPMTHAQASYLKSLAEEAREPEAFDDCLTRKQATRRIDVLRARLGFPGNPVDTD